MTRTTWPNEHTGIPSRVQIMYLLSELPHRYNQTFTFDPKTRKAALDNAKFPPA